MKKLISKFQPGGSPTISAMNRQKQIEYNDASEKLLTRKYNNGSIYIPSEDTYYGSSLPEFTVSTSKGRGTGTADSRHPVYESVENQIDPSLNQYRSWTEQGKHNPVELATDLDFAVLGAGQLGTKVASTVGKVGQAVIKVATNPELKQAVKTAYNMNSAANNKTVVNNMLGDVEDGFAFTKGTHTARMGYGTGSIHTGHGISIGAKKDGTFGLNLAGGAENPKAVLELKQVMSELPKGSSISGDAHTPSVAAHIRNRFNNGQYSSLIDEINSGQFDTSMYPIWNGMFDGMSPDAMSMLGRMAKDNPKLYHIEYGTTPAGKFNHLAKPEGRNAFIYDLQQKYDKGLLDVDSYKTQIDAWLKGIGLKSSYIDDNGIVQISQPFLVRNKQGGKL